MKDWVGFSKEAGADTMAKVGQWNLAVAARSLAEAVQDLVASSSKADTLPHALAQGRTYEFAMKGGERLVGKVQHFEKLWIVLALADERTAAVRASEVASFRESGA